METFVFFQTAEQLEKIILGTLAENLDVILGAGIDEVNVGFTTENADGKNCGTQTKTLWMNTP